jgi:hypothetical protein
MQLSQLIQELQAIQAEHGDLPVLKEDGRYGDIFELEDVQRRVATEDEYPADWDMPAGFEFVLLCGD